MDHDTTLDTEPTVAELIPAGHNQAMVTPVATLDDVKQAWRNYERICAEVLDEHADYQKIGNRRFRKRSAWRKLGIVFGIRVDIDREDIMRWDDAPRRSDRLRVMHAEYLVRATAPNGRAMQGYGQCDVWERCCPPPLPDSDGAEQMSCTNTAQRHTHCPAAHGHECPGWTHFSHANHDVPATAMTRAINRAFADLFGMGEVCVPERAEALTPAGWVNPDKLAVGDTILAYDADTDECRWVPVRGLHRYPAGQTFAIGHSRWSFTATSGHRWPVQRKRCADADPGREMRRTDDLLRGEPTLILSRPVATDGDVDPRDAALVGWIITDGHIEHAMVNGYGPYQRIRITQRKHLDALRVLCAGDATERVQRQNDGDTYIFELRADAVRGLVARTGLHTKADAVALIYRLGHDARQAMLDAMMLANGSVNPSGQQTFCTGRPEVMDAFHALAACHGIALGPTRSASDGRNVQYVTLRRSGGVVAQLGSFKIEPAAVEPVWCPETELGTWVCRLDGVVTITGNSAEEVAEQAEAEQRAANVTEWHALLAEVPGERANRWVGYQHETTGMEFEEMAAGSQGKWLDWLRRQHDKWQAETSPDTGAGDHREAAEPPSGDDGKPEPAADSSQPDDADPQPAGDTDADRRSRLDYRLQMIPTDRRDAWIQRVADELDTDDWTTLAGSELLTAMRWLAD